MGIECIVNRLNEVTRVSNNYDSPGFNFDSRIDARRTQDYIDNPGYNPDRRFGTSVEKTENHVSNTHDLDKRIDTLGLWDAENKGIPEISIVLKQYLETIRFYSDVPDTLCNTHLSADLLERPNAEKISALKNEYSQRKDELIAQWEKDNGREWPRYNEDVYIRTKSGDMVKIRKAGDLYDAHHIHPLSMGGKNEADNLTPLRADIHFDHRGVHAKNGPFGILEKQLGAKET